MFLFEVVFAVFTAAKAAAQIGSLCFNIIDAISRCVWILSHKALKCRKIYIHLTQLSSVNLAQLHCKTLACFCSILRKIIPQFAAHIFYYCIAEYFQCVSACSIICQNSRENRWLFSSISRSNYVLRKMKKKSLLR